MITQLTFSPLISMTPLNLLGMEPKNLLNFQASFLFENVVLECVLHHYHLRTLHVFTSCFFK